MNLREAKELTGGGLGYPSKMPGTSYGISAHACITGAKLATVPGSVCHGCYALRNNYNYPSVATAHERRLASIAGPHWTAGLVFLLQREYNAVCREYTDLIHKHAKQAKRIKRSLLKRTGYQSRIRDVGFGLAQLTKTDMDIIQKRAVLNPAMYPLTLPVSGATVELSQKALGPTITVASVYALIQSICNYLEKPTICDYMPQNGATQLPDGLHLTYYMRHHDSGDLQSVDHLLKICAVAALTPDIKHWLPTREFDIVQAYIAKGGRVPNNLTIRVSATMVDGRATSKWSTTSGVHTDPPAWGKRHVCPAPLQGNNCGECRACWSREVAHVSYHKH